MCHRTRLTGLPLVFFRLAQGIRYDQKSLIAVANVNDKYVTYDIVNLS